MGNSKHEDAIMKMGFHYFRDTILKLLGIDHNYVDIGPTELVELTIHSLYMDFTFLTTSGTYVHIEFQTTDGGTKDLRRFHAYEAVLAHESGKNVMYMDFTFLTTSGTYVHIEFQTTDGGTKDLRRFHAYEAVLAHESGKNVITYVIYSGGIKGTYVHIEFQTTDGGTKDLRRFHAYEAVLAHESGKNVITYVIYSGGIKKTKTELDCGAYTYRIMPIYMTSRDAEEVFRRLSEKKEQGEEFTERDYAELSLTPLMSSALSRKETLKEALLLAKTGDSVTAQKSIAILYALADKFLDNCDLDEIREVTAMTRLGQMLYDDGFKKGEEKGFENGCQSERQNMTKLTRILLEENRLEDLKRATEDKEFLEQLMKE